MRNSLHSPRKHDFKFQIEFIVAFLILVYMNSLLDKTGSLIMLCVFDSLSEIKGEK